MKRLIPESTREKGMAILITALMLVFTIPIVGLAIDAGLLYVIRARLTAACDAASLATARNLNLGLTLAQQTAAATTRGQAFFAANFPSGYLGTSGTNPTITIAQTNASTLTVTTTASTNAPMYFMRFMGNNASVAGAVGKASRRDVNLMLVLDHSGSMQGNPCASMISAAQTFTNMFVNGRDTIGMVTFGGNVYLAYPPTQQFKDPVNPINTKITSITCGGNTNSAQSYWTAYQQLVAINEPLALNMIVYFTDGKPTAFSANFPIKTLDDTRYGYTNGACAINVQCTIPKTSCNDDTGKVVGAIGWGTFAPKFGAVYSDGSENTTGQTQGLILNTVSTFSTSQPLVTSGTTNCQFRSSDQRFRRDIAYFPDTDANNISTTGYQSVNRFNGGAVYPNKIRPDEPINVTHIGMNLADNMGVAMRADANINPVTFTLGLDGNGGFDDVLLKRMANDITSPTYDNTKQAGLYVYAPNASQLNAAFARIASEILRLAQ